MIAALIHSLTGTITSTKKTIFRNTVWLTGAEIGSRILRGVLSIVAARLLGAEGLGIFSYAIALGGLITFFEEAGIGTYVTRSFAREDTNRSSVFGTALILKIITGVIALLLFVGVGPIVSSMPQSNGIIPVVALLLFCDQLRGFFFAITRAQERMHIDAGIQIGTNVLIAGLGIAALAINPTPLFLTLGYTTGSLLGTIAAIVMVWNYIPRPLLKSFSYPILKDILRAAWPFVTLAVSNVLIFNTDSLFLGYYRTPTDVGLYGAASRLVMMFYVLASLFTVATFPALVHKIKEGLPIRSAIAKSLALMMLVAVPLIAVMTIGAPLVMKLLFGGSFIAAAPILAILSLTYIPVFVRVVLNNAILAKDIQSQFVVANLIGVAVNIGLDYLLIPHHSGVGAAVASVAGLTVISIITAIQLRHYLRQDRTTKTA